MSRNTILSFTVLIAAAILVGCGGQPDAQLDSTFHDFGDVPQFDVVTVDIPLSNPGVGTLEIRSVSTSCGCTSASVSDVRVEPGGETLLTIHYDSGLHPDSGPIYRTVFVETNDPNQPELQVEVIANVVAPEG